METWLLDFEWLKVRHYIKDSMNYPELPKLDTILFLIGIQESGVIKTDYSKEEKQDLMHVAVCELLISENIYEFVGRDDDGWPHYKQKKSIETNNIKYQETLLKEKVIGYFSLEKEEKSSEM